MKTCCCSSHCKKYFDCQLADINNEGMNIVENYHEWGSGTYTDEGCVTEYYCGELGDYKMFEPIEKDPNSLAEIIPDLYSKYEELAAKLDKIIDSKSEDNEDWDEDDEYDDFFGIYTREEYEKATEEHHKWIENMAKVEEEKNLDDAEVALAELTISTKNAKGEYRPLGEVLEEVCRRWAELES